MDIIGYVGVITVLHGCCA